MEKKSSASNKIFSQSHQSLSNHTTNIQKTKTYMKKLLFCGHCQQKSASPLFESVDLVETNTNLLPNSNMAADNSEENGWYTTECGESQYTLPVRYQELAPIGRGAFGSVIRATDTETGVTVAIKKLHRPFQTPTHAKRTYRELKLLNDLNRPNTQVIQLYNVFTPEPNVQEFQTLYFVFNFVDYDLNKVIRRRIPFSEDLVKHIIYSLLRGLKFMHSAGILHRDLKPVNIGVDRDSNVTILDFGLARVASDGVQTGYVATRWWRAPEVYVNWEQYNEKLDIWSVGCIMGELIRLQSLFRGNGHIDQLNKIFDIIGTPDLAILNQICTPDTCQYIGGLPQKPKQDFNRLFGYTYNPGSTTPVSGVSPEGINLLDSLLSFDPRTRPTASEALAHPFFNDYHDPEEEPTMEQPLDDQHQDAAHSVSQWKSIIWQMVQDFEPPTFTNDDLGDQAMNDA